jgi:hypothetical protein
VSSVDALARHGTLDIEQRANPLQRLARYA